jgi:hypothetical protein
VLGHSRIGAKTADSYTKDIGQAPWGLRELPSCTCSGGATPGLAHCEWCAWRWCSWRNGGPR